MADSREQRNAAKLAALRGKQLTRKKPKQAPGAHEETALFPKVCACGEKVMQKGGQVTRYTREGGFEIFHFFGCGSD
jgi:hypothetical protein